MSLQTNEALTDAGIDDQRTAGIRLRTAPRRPSRIRRALVRTAVTVAVLAVLAVMIGPLLVVVAASFTASSYVAFPPEGFTLRWYGDAFSNPQMVASLLHSIGVALGAAALSTVLAILLGLGVDDLRERLAARRNPAFVAGIRSYALLPMMIPSVIIAVALLLYLTRIGLISMPFALVIAYAVNYFPYAFLMTEVGLANAPVSLRRSAQILGARHDQVLRHVTGPLALPGIAAGFAMVFVMSFSEVTIAVFLQQPGTVTLPVYLFNKLYAQPPTPDLTAMSASVTVGTVAVIAAILLLFGRGSKQMLARR